MDRFLVLGILALQITVLVAVIYGESLGRSQFSTLMV